MNSALLRLLLILALYPAFAAPAQNPKPQTSPPNGGDFAPNPKVLNKVPQGVILVKGAWSSASDSVTPIPEGGSVTNGVFNDQYFGMSYMLPPDWEEKYKGPPPSDSGRYVLAQLRPVDSFRGARATFLITSPIGPPSLNCIGTFWPQRSDATPWKWS